MQGVVKQTDKPLYPDIFWNRPVTAKSAKKLLIIGGHSKQFSNVQTAYAAAKAAGIGHAKTVLPDSLRKYVGTMDDCLLVPSTPSGSIAKDAYTLITAYIEESDGVLLAGELTHNAETISLVEQILAECQKPIFITSEVIGMMAHHPAILQSAYSRIFILNSKAFLKLTDPFEIIVPHQLSRFLVNLTLLKALPQVTIDYVLCDEVNIFAQSQNQTSLTPAENTGLIEQIIAPIMATFWLQQPHKFEALTTAAFVVARMLKDSRNAQSAITKLPKILSS